MTVEQTAIDVVAIVERNYPNDPAAQKRAVRRFGPRGYDIGVTLRALQILSERTVEPKPDPERRMTDVTLVCAEMRAAELLTTLQSAVNGDAHWRLQAAELLRAIGNHELPEPATEALREIDARKRAAEILEDVCSDE